MREIKFRAWHIKRKVMNLDICNLSYYRKGEYVKDDEGSWIIMQFTGLKDKNEKEIYEGDIVEEITETEKKIYKIVWKKYHCQFEAKPVNFKSMLDFGMNTIFTEVRVIGNIYENPELLEDSNE